MDHEGSKFEVSILRRKAEELLTNNKKKSGSSLSEVEILKLIHEIEVHQIELELQNEELKISKDRAIEIGSEKYAELYDFAPSGYFTLSKEGEIIDLNIAASKILGKERAGLIKSRLGFFVSDDTKLNINNFLKNIFESHEKETCLITLQTNSDLPVFVYLTGISTKNNEQCLLNVTDITKLIEARNQIRDLSLIATQTDNLVIITDAKGAIEYVNNAFEKLTGYILKEVAGKKPGSFLHGPETNPETKAAISLALLKREAISIEILNYTRSGEKYWISASINPVFDNKGELEKFIAIQQNITSQKENENKILDANQRLRSLTAHLQSIQEEERINIAREIHDELGQQLTGIKLDASWLRNKTKIYLEEEKERMDRLINNINTTINNVRKIASNLRPGVLDDLGLEAAIEWQAAKFEEQNGISCLLKTSNVSDNYDKTVNTAVYRIFQEALTNVSRHANASKVTIKLYEKNGILALEVADNGKGIWETENNKTQSLGITGMKERAFMINGTFSIKKGKEGGTIVSLSVPL
jgi:PAS domain S-box-containing protein